jgi:hypothetical protein
MATRTIRASEIGAYLYCKRAWWFQRQGIESDNQVELSAGSVFHQQHAGKVWTARLLRLAGWCILLLAITLLAIALTTKWFG